MTRDEAIEWLLNAAETAGRQHSSLLPTYWERFAEAKAALAEPSGETEAEATVRCAQAVLDDPAMRPTFLRLAGLKEEDTKGATLTDWFCFFFNADGRRFRCQHQAADASLDCAEPAVLCETHGGHDACAVEIMRLEGALVDALREGFAAKAQAEQRTRDEIARALYAAGERAARGGTPHTASAWCQAAKAIRDGSIREWLSGEGA